MTVFIIRRLLQSIVVVFLMSLLVFVGVNVVGDPVDMLINPEADQAEIDRVIRHFGLDKPIHMQYWHFLTNALQGDLGKSFIFGMPALQLILMRMPATLELAFSALILAIVIGIPLGVYAGLKPEAKVSRTIMASSILGFSLPTFWVGLMMIVVFSLNLGWFPTSGMTNVAAFYEGWDYVVDVSRHLVLPTITLSLFYLALYTRMMRASMLEQYGQDYVVTARAKGLTERRITYVHVLRNALLPVVTMAGVQVGALIGGSVIVESVFAWPGLGMLAFESLFARDLNLLLGIFLLSSMLVVAVNLIVDIIYCFLDPRIEVS